MSARPGSRVGLQVAGTMAVAVAVVGLFANLRDEPAPVPTGEQSQVRGIAESDLRSHDVAEVTPTPVEKPAAAAPAEVKREARKPAPRKEPVRTAAIEPAPVDPGPPLPIAPPAPSEDSLVANAGKTSLAVLRTSTEFVTDTVPKAVVSTTRDALDKAKSIGTAVLDKVKP